MKGDFQQAEGKNLSEIGRAKEILRVQAVYEQIPPAAERGEGRGIVVIWAFGLNQGDSSHIGITGGLNNHWRE